MSYQKSFIWCQTSQFSKEWLLCKKICTTMMMFTVEKDHLLVVFCWRLLLKTPMTSTRRNSDGGKKKTLERRSRKGRSLSILFIFSVVWWEWKVLELSFVLLEEGPMNQQEGMKKKKYIGGYLPLLFVSLFFLWNITEASKHEQ